MSASERLVAVGERAKEDRYLTIPQARLKYGDVWTRESQFAQSLLYLALPEIVAVVRAAEHVTFYGQEAHRFNEWHGSELLNSIAALEEKLGKDKP